MNLDEILAGELRRLDEHSLRRRLKEVGGAQGRFLMLEGRRVLNFSGNDYLGLANHPALLQAARESMELYGLGSGASRLLSGTQTPHLALEKELAQWKNTEASLVFSSGYAAATGGIPALAGPGDVLFLDKLCHACLIDGARLSGGRIRIFPHGDLGRLEKLLASEQRRDPEARRWILTESVFSMDGDLADLPGLVELKEKYGAALVIDEAHAVGVFGPDGSGRIREEGLEGRVEVQMGTLSKAAGVAGGYLAGSTVLREYLVNRARSFVFSTAPPAALADATREALRLMGGEEGRQRLTRLRSLIEEARSLLGPWLRPGSGASPVFPVQVRDEAEAMRLCDWLLERGVYIPGIRYPTVPRKQARLRVSLSASHQPGDLVRLRELLEEAM